MAKQLTIRNVPDEVAEKLARLSEEKKTSLNATVVEILERAVGSSGRRERLARYMTWTEQDQAEFDAALEAQRVIDDDLWR